MASGLPVIGSEVAGIPEAVRNEVTGLLFPPGDVAALAGQIERLARNPEMGRRLISSARKLVEKSYSREACLDHLVEILRSVHGPVTRRNSSGERNGHRSLVST